MDKNNLKNFSAILAKKLPFVVFHFIIIFMLVKKARGDFYFFIIIKLTNCVQIRNDLKSKNRPQTRRVSLMAVKTAHRNSEACLYPFLAIKGNAKNISYEIFQF